MNPTPPCAGPEAAGPSLNPPQMVAERNHTAANPRRISIRPPVRATTGRALTHRDHPPALAGEGGQELVAEGVHPPDRCLRAGPQALLPAPAGDPVQDGPV